MDPQVGWAWGFTTSKGEYLFLACSACGADKPVEDFYADRSRASGRQQYCKACSNEKLRAWRAANPERARAARRRQSHGADIQATGVCEICGERDATCVDHSHGCCPSGKSCGACRRGFLCTGCNLAIGHLRDRADLARLAADYLEAWRGLETGLRDCG